MGLEAANKERFMRTFMAIAAGTMTPNDLGPVLDGLTTHGLATKQQIAAVMGVQESHVFKKAQDMSPRKIRQFCQKFDFAA